jgi:hypothetical protein
MENTSRARLYYTVGGRHLIPVAEKRDMTRFLGALLALLIVATGVSRPAGPPHRAAIPGTTPLLSIREVEVVCPGSLVMMPESMPEKRPGTFFLRVTVQVPCTEIVFVPRTTRVKRTRLVYGPVDRRVSGPVLVPITTRQKKLQMVFREQPRKEVPQAVYVPQEVKQLRPLYRTVSRQVPYTQDVYVPIVSRQKKTVMVYEAEPVQITRTVPSIRTESTQVHDPAMGKMMTINKPVCEHRKVTETVTRYVLRPRVIEEDVTSYRLERRTFMRTVEDYVLEQRLEPVTNYHLEIRPVRETLGRYVCEPEVVEETVTNSRLEHRERETVIDYVPEWREVEEEVTSYHLEARRVLRPVEQFVPCHGEIIVPLTREQEVPMMRKRWVAEPLAAGAVPGCVTASGGGLTVIGGAMVNVPVYGRTRLSFIGSSASLLSP